MKKEPVKITFDSESRWNIPTIIKGLKSLQRERAEGSASLVDPLAEALEQAIRALRKLKLIHDGGKK